MIINKAICLVVMFSIVLNSFSLNSAFASQPINLTSENLTNKETINHVTLTGEELQWETIVFGQSTDVFFNSTGLSPEQLSQGEFKDRYGTILNESGSIEWFDNNFIRDMEGNNVASGSLVSDFEIESRGGKVTLAHDGITFYYTRIPTTYNFVLSADVTLVQLGPLGGANPNGQEGIGLMVRDVIGEPRREFTESGFEELTASSNMVTARLQRTVGTELYWCLFERDGVVLRSGNPNTITNRKEVFPVKPGDTFNVVLERHDDGFTVTYTDSEGMSKTVSSAFGADVIQRIEQDYMYVGFFAARNAHAYFSNAKITLSEANTKPTPEHQPEKEMPKIINLSPSSTAARDYTYATKFNYHGKVTLKVDGNEVVSNQPIEAYEPFKFEHRLVNNTTLFEVYFTPYEGAPETDPIKDILRVEINNDIRNPMEIFVSPNAYSPPRGNGTLERPTTLETAIRYVAPGGTIYLLEGDYLDERIHTTFDISGLKGRTKTIMPYNNHEVRFLGESSGAQLDGDFWHIKNFEIAGGNIRIRGNNNIVENMIVHSHINTGVQIGNGTGFDYRGWPSNNLILNTASFNHTDPRLIDADGFAAKLGVGVGNVFRGCIAFNNIDDGWDLYNKLEEGPNMPVTIEYSIAFNNGINLNGDISGAGNGFKLGGEGMAVDHIVRHNIAFNNLMDGFSCNFNPGAIIMENNTAFDNSRHNYIFRTNSFVKPENQGIFVNNISIRSDNGNINPDYISGNIHESNLFFDLNGTGSTGASINDLISIVPPAYFERNENNHIIINDFLVPILRSILGTGGAGYPFADYMGALEPK